MRYTAIGHRSQYFELYNDVNLPLGTVNYSEWLSANATISLPDGDNYVLGPANFWMTSMEMSKEGVTVATAKRNWAMNVIITIGSAAYHFQAEGLLNRYYMLVTEQNEEIAVLKPNFHWHDLNFSYEIEINDNYSELTNPAIILFLIYSCNYITRNRTAGAI